MSQRPPRFNKMIAKFNGQCVGCNARLTRGEDIYYSRDAGGAFCTSCGAKRFEPVAETPAQPSTPDLTTNTYRPPTRRELDTPERVQRQAPPAPNIQLAEGQVIRVQALTNTRQCYCHLVKRKCGVCVARDLELQNGVVE